MIRVLLADDQTLVRAASAMLVESEPDIARVLSGPRTPVMGAPGGPDCLSARERQVLGLVARGLNNTEIAETLGPSPLTAKTHVSRIMGKLCARDRAQLVIIAYESGLVVPAGGRE